MASEDTGEVAGMTVSDDVRRWLQQRADEHGVDVELFLQELLAAHSALDDPDDPLDLDDTGLDEDDRPTGDELEEIRSEFRELVEDVRSRVIQVKRETDAKAPADHDHEALDETLQELRSELSALDDELDGHQEQIEALTSTVDAGFDNFEDVLDYLLETSDDLAERTDRLARATIGTRERVQELAGSIQKREAADRLKRDAALEGVSSADCGDCGQSVPVALLTRPDCPFCAATFVDLEPKRGFLGSATFTTGDRPALAGTEDDPVSEELRSDVERDRPDPADVDWDTAGDDEP